jgi:hypothetical protein
MQSCRNVLIFQRKLPAPLSRQMNKCWYKRQDRYKDRMAQGRPLAKTKWHPSLSGVSRKTGKATGRRSGGWEGELMKAGDMKKYIHK